MIPGSIRRNYVGNSAYGQICPWGGRTWPVRTKTNANVSGASAFRSINLGRKLGNRIIFRSARFIAYKKTQNNKIRNSEGEYNMANDKRYRIVKGKE